LFDKQLISRGVAIGRGREQIILNEVLIKEYIDKEFTKFNENTSIEQAITQLKKDRNTEGYIVSKENKYLGKVNLIDLIKVNNKEIKKCTIKNPIVIDPNSTLLEVIKTLADFVGESIPIVSKKTKEMYGIISENDVLAAYLKISEEINQIEKH